jgi:hypothetical protein
MDYQTDDFLSKNPPDNGGKPWTPINVITGLPNPSQPGPSPANSGSPTMPLSSSQSQLAGKISSIAPNTSYSGTQGVNGGINDNSFTGYLANSAARDAALTSKAWKDGDLWNSIGNGLATISGSIAAAPFLALKSVADATGFGSNKNQSYDQLRAPTVSPVPSPVNATQGFQGQQNAQFNAGASQGFQGAQNNQFNTGASQGFQGQQNAQLNAGGDGYSSGKTLAQRVSDASLKDGGEMARQFFSKNGVTNESLRQYGLLQGSSSPNGAYGENNNVTGVPLAGKDLNAWNRLQDYLIERSRHSDENREHERFTLQNKAEDFWNRAKYSRDPRIVAEGAALLRAAFGREDVDADTINAIANAQKFTEGRIGQSERERTDVPYQSLVDQRNMQDMAVRAALDPNGPEAQYLSARQALADRMGKISVDTETDPYGKKVEKFTGTAGQFNAYNGGPKYDAKSQVYLDHLRQLQALKAQNKISELQALAAIGKTKFKDIPEYQGVLNRLGIS